MAKKTVKVIKSKPEILKELGEKRRSLRGIRFGEAGSRTTNVKAQKGLRREIAVLLSQLPTAK